MFLLDTNTISYFFRKNPQVTQKISTIKDPNTLLSCSIVASELLFGALQNLSKKDSLIQFYNIFFQKVEIVDYDLKAAQVFAKIKTELSLKGQLIEDFDLMIATICLTNKLTLVTNNIKYFSKIQNLKLEDWTK